MARQTNLKIIQPSYQEIKICKNIWNDNSRDIIVLDGDKGFKFDFETHEGKYEFDCGQYFTFDNRYINRNYSIKNRERGDQCGYDSEYCIMGNVRIDSPSYDWVCGEKTIHVPNIQDIMRIFMEKIAILITHMQSKGFNAVKSDEYQIDVCSICQKEKRS